MYKIAAFILCYNEEKILPHTIKHYGRFCEDIFILNNGSTDRSIEIAKNMGCKVINYESNEINELQYINIKQNCYKEYRHVYDYVIVCDADEFLYHKNLFEYIKKYPQVDVFKLDGYEMSHENFDYEEDDYQSIKLACPSSGHNKCALFKPKVDIEYGIGCHSSRNPSFQSSIEMRHLKFINIDFVFERYAHFAQRRSAINKQNGWAYHYAWEKQKILDYQNKIKSKLREVDWNYE